MVEIMMYLWLTVWQPVVFDLEHGQVDGQEICEMAHTSQNASAGNANSNAKPNR